jgi:hypothetical protein
MVSFFGSLVAQDLSKHNWQNRLIVILTNNAQNEKYKNQVAAFKNEKEGFDERKLVVYHVTPSEYKTGFDNRSWKKSSLLYERFKKSDSDFEVLLLGLDGGVKLRQDSLLTVQKLYSTIDVMPMRRQEIERKK